MTESSNTVIFFHENAGNIGHRLYYLYHYYMNVECNILLVAYRGFSDSEGTTTEEGISNILLLKLFDINGKEIDI